MEGGLFIIRHFVIYSSFMFIAKFDQLGLYLYLSITVHTPPLIIFISPNSSPNNLLFNAISCIVEKMKKAPKTLLKKGFEGF